MAELEWSAELSVGILKIDEQHNKLIEMMCELDCAVRNKREADVVEDVLVEVFNYAQMHFAAEEELFRKHKYPELALHELEHQRFIAKAFALKERYDSNRPGLSIELLSFLSDWIVTHIKVTDKRYSAHLKKCGVV